MRAESALSDLVDRRFDLSPETLVGVKEFPGDLASSKFSFGHIAIIR